MLGGSPCTSRIERLHLDRQSRSRYLAQLEKDIKKEFTAAAKKIKAAQKTTLAPPRGKKRTYDETATDTRTTNTTKAKPSPTKPAKKTASTETQARNIQSKSPDKPA